MAGDRQERDDPGPAVPALPVQPLAKHRQSSQCPGSHRGRGNALAPGDLLGGHLVEEPRHEGRPVGLGEFAHGLQQAILRLEALCDVRRIRG